MDLEAKALEATRLERELAEARHYIAELSEELDETSRGLLALDLELEDRVQERTRQLRETNVRLEEALRSRREAEHKLEGALADSQRSREEVSALLKGAKAVLEAPGFWAAARSIYDICKDLIGAQSGYVALASADGEINELLFLDSGGQPCSVNPELEMPIRGLRAEAYRTARPVYDNSFNHSRWADLLPSGHMILENVLFAPLNIDGAAAGIMGFANKPGGFSENDLAIAAAFGETAALALRNSRLREALEHSENLFRNVFAQRTDGALIHDLDGVISDANHKLVEMLGYSYDEIIGLNFQALFPPAFADSFWKLLQQLATDSSVSSRSDLVGKNGNLLPVELTSSIINIKGRNMFQCVARDLTETIATRREKQLLEEQLRQSQKMEAIGSLAGGIAHDFNNILAAIMGYAELTLQDLPYGSRERDNLGGVIQAAHRAKDLIGQILSFSRQVDQDESLVDLRTITEEAMRMLRASIPRMVDIREDLEQSEMTVMADPTKIHQVIVNLCTNAAQALREQGGTIDISLKSIDINARESRRFVGLEPGPCVRLTICDDGPGMSREVMDRIFDPFFTTKQSGEGTGLGLTVVHRIVVAHKGAITVNSQLGQGTVFNVYLPLSGQVDSTAQVQAVKESATGNETILLVDDEPDLVTLSSRALQRLGYEVAVTTSSLEALEMIRSDPRAFDLLITDYAMPELTGTQLARAALAERGDLPVILCSGYSEEISRAKAADIGICRFLMKPMLPSEMAVIIREVLKG